MEDTTREKKESESQIKLRIILPSRSSSLPRKEVVLYVPRSQNQKREPSKPSDSPSNKRCKVMVSSDTQTKIEETTRVIAQNDSRNAHQHVDMMRNVTKDHAAYPTKTACKHKEKIKKPLTKRVFTKDSRFVDEEKKIKMSSVITHEVSTINNNQYPTKTKPSSPQYGARTSRSGNEEKHKLKKKKNARVVMEMDHCKKMQCWVILKRLMTGRDSWVFKEPMMGLDIIDNHNHNHHESKSLLSKPLIKSEVVFNKTSMKPTSLNDIESKLRNLLYTNADEFAQDIRVLFSYGLLHPPRNDIYKITRRLSEGFELKWNSMKEKWLSQD